MVNVNSQIDAVTRGLRTDDVDGASSRIQTVIQEYPASIEDVWDAVTTTERIARWFLPVVGDLQVGGRYQLTGNASGEVLSCTPPSNGAANYHVTWELGGGVSWVTVRLTSLAADRTRFELEHTARVADIPEQMWETFGPGATGVGWDQALLGLALHFGVHEGRIEPDEGAEWALTEEGKAFTRAAADRWAEAYTAAGADRDTAARTADATYGFYTGETAGA